MQECVCVCVCVCVYVCVYVYTRIRWRAGVSHSRINQCETVAALCLPGRGDDT